MGAENISAVITRAIRQAGFLMLAPPVLWFDFQGSWKNTLPILLHIHDGPAVSPGLIEGFVETANGGLTIAGIFTLGVGVMDDEVESRPGSAVVHWIICRSPSELPKAAMGRCASNGSALGLPLVSEGQRFSCRRQRGKRLCGGQ